MILAKCLERSSLPRRFLSYLGRAEAVACPPNNFFNDNTSDNNTTNNNDATTNNNLLNNNNNKAPPPRPPKPSRQALNLFQWRQQQEQEIERIRTFGHDSLLPPARYSPYCHCFFLLLCNCLCHYSLLPGRPPKGEVDEGGGCLLLLPPASPSPRRSVMG